MNAAITSVGKTSRMNRIFRGDGRAAMVAMNQGITWGPKNGLEDPETILKELLPYQPDSFTMHKGMAMCTADIWAGRTEIILKATNRTRFSGRDEIQVASVLDAVRLDAAAISFGLTLADTYEQRTLEMISRLVSEANEYGMPTVAHAYPSGDKISDDVRYSVEYVGYASRVAKEIGIDVIKTYWTGSSESFGRIVEVSAPCKVVISGGPKCETLRACFEMTWQGIQAGCHGITYGRNIWQHECPPAVLRGLNAIIHEGASVDEALELASEVAGKKLI